MSVLQQMMDVTARYLHNPRTRSFVFQRLYNNSIVYSVLEGQRRIRWQSIGHENRGKTGRTERTCRVHGGCLRSPCNLHARSFEPMQTRRRFAHNNFADCQIVSWFCPRPRCCVWPTSADYLDSSSNDGRYLDVAECEYLAREQWTD